MEKRSAERINLSMTANINNRPGTLLDLSRDGLRLVTAHTPDSGNIAISIVSGAGSIDIEGDIRWAARKSPLQSFQEIGVAIKNAPLEYYYLLDEILSSHRPSGSFFLFFIFVVVMALFFFCLVLF